MSMTSIWHKSVPSPTAETEDEWPMLSKRAAAIAHVRDAGVTFGWRLKNLGLERFGLWIVRKCHRGSSTATG